MSALALFSVVLLITLAIVRSRYGRVLVAVRENEERTKMLGYDTFANKLAAVTASGTISAAAGAAFALLFGYVGANFATVQYSILPLLWVLLGGAATTLGPLLGTLVMYVVTDTASSFTSAWLLIVGVVLILLVLFFPKGILGTLRARWLGWLP
jgi:branched-chain amino acid transport system permease protein